MRKKIKSSRICFLCFSIEPGGGNRVIFEICDRIDRTQGTNYDLIYVKNSDSHRSQKIASFSKASRLKMRAMGIINNHFLFIPLNILITLVYLLISGWKYQSIIINSSLLAPFFWLIPYGNVYNYIQADDYTIFDGRFSRKTKFLLNTYKWATKNISYQLYRERYIFNSKFTQERFELVSARKIFNSKLMVPGVDLEIFHPLVLLDLPQKDSTIVVTSILRKQPWKGTADFLIAIEELSQQLSKDVKFIGITNEDISSLKIPSILTIYKPASDEDLVHFLQQSDIFVVTSHWEGFGLTGLEAMACGCALISTDNGGCNEYTKNGVNCILYEPQNINDLIKNITWLLGNKDLRQQLSKEGLITATKNSWQRTFENMQKLLAI
jgi:glycosyltransferase involved in cell wall biosynthesis